VLSRLGVSNVEFQVGDGSCGWPGEKFFDRIMITAAVPKMPEPLMGPVGYVGVQELVVCEKRAERITEKVICDCRFVRLLGKYGFEE
jgi:protein-L-isoaspartate(D-aspartate) O-methyltransferase